MASKQVTNIVEDNQDIKVQKVADAYKTKDGTLYVCVVGLYGNGGYILPLELLSKNPKSEEDHGFGRTQIHRYYIPKTNLIKECPPSGIDKAGLERVPIDTSLLDEKPGKATYKYLDLLRPKDNDEDRIFLYKDNQGQLNIVYVNKIAKYEGRHYIGFGVAPIYTGSNPFGLLLYPFSIALDIITFPLQALFYVLLIAGGSW